MNLLVPLPLDPEDRPLLPRLHAALVAELYKQSRAALAGLTLLLGFFRVIVDEAVPRSPWLGWVFGFLAAVTSKVRLGTGGTVKQGVLEIQGDRRDLIKAELEAAGYKVRLIG